MSMSLIRAYNLLPGDVVIDGGMVKTVATVRHVEGNLYLTFKGFERHLTALMFQDFTLLGRAQRHDS